MPKCRDKIEWKMLQSSIAYVTQNQNAPIEIEEKLLEPYIPSAIIHNC